MAGDESSRSFPFVAAVVLCYLCNFTPPAVALPDGTDSCVVYWWIITEMQLPATAFLTQY